LVFNRTDRGRHRGRDAMALEALIILVIVGAIAGWLAGLIVKGVDLAFVSFAIEFFGVLEMRNNACVLLMCILNKRRSIPAPCALRGAT
jgi:hypothetical protein